MNDEIEIVGLADEPTKTVVTGIEMFHKLLDQGQAGDNAGLLLRGIERDDVDLVRIVETLGKNANNSYSNLKIVELPLWVMEKGWVIKETDGWEHIAENHCTWD